MTSPPDPAGGAPDPLRRLSAAALSSGDVQVRVHGVRDGAHLTAVLSAMRAIRGVGDVTLRAHGTVHDPVLVLRTIRPIALAGDLRNRFGRQVVSCLVVDGGIELRLVPGSATGDLERRPEPPVRDERGPTGPGRPGEPAAIDAPAGAAAGRPTGSPGAGRRTRGAPGTWARGAGRPDPDAAGSPGGGASPTAPAGSAIAVEDGLRQAIDAIDTLSVLTFDADLRFVATAGSMHERLGLAAPALLGRRPAELTGADDWPALAPGYRGALQGRTVTLQTPSPDGRSRLQATFRPLFSGPRVVGGTVTLLDVTAEQRDERRLSELRDVLASAFDRSPVGQALLSPEGEWMRVNEALRRLLDRADESLVGTNLRDLTHAEDRDREEALMYGVRLGHQDGYDIEKRVTRGDGVQITVHARMTAIRTDRAGLRGFIAHVDERGHWDAGRR